VVGTVRDERRRAPLEALGVEVLVVRELREDALRPHLRAPFDSVVTFPPDGATDALLAPALARARGLVYVSTTGVYGPGDVDDTTPVSEAPSARARLRLDAERAWRAAGATVLRAPAIYGHDRGLHVRIREGKHRIPGDGTRYISRVHVEDLTSFLLAALRVRAETFVVGDDEPARHIDVVSYVCRHLGLPMPEHAPLESVDETLRADRRVDASRAKRVLGVTLRYPNYRVGMAG
jgi:nucleoside-diphosphate-sugar epimerase